MKKTVALLFLSVISLFALEERNILLDTDFNGDPEETPGIIGVWNVKNADAANTPLVLLPGEAPDGKNAVRVKIPKGEIFRQGDITLVAGEKYRFGAYVRTKGFKSPTASIRIWNLGWTRDVVSQPIPSDTNGQWVKIEGVATMPSSKSTYTYGIYAMKPEGYIDFACPYLIPLSEKALAGSSVKVPTHTGALDLSRVIPVDPLLSQIDVSNPKMKFYLPGQKSEALAKCILGVQIKMADDADFLPWQYYDANETRFIEASLGKLKEGEGTMRVVLFKKGEEKPLSRNEYAIRVIKLPPKVTLKPLNNLVSEILDIELKNGEVSFYNPREGWVFIGFDRPYQGATVTLNGGERPVVFFREGEPSDCMTVLPLGNHVLRIANAPANGGRLVVRAVPELMLYPLILGKERSFDNYMYDLDFYKKYLLHSANLFQSGNWLPKSEFDLAVDRELSERSFKIITSHGLNRLKDEKEIDDMADAIRNNPIMKRNWGLAADELDVSAYPPRVLATAEAFWKLTDLDRRLGIWFCGVENSQFTNPRIHYNLLSACVNSSRGRGKILLETYVGSRLSDDALKEYYEYISRQMESIDKLVPNAPEHVMMMMCGYVSPGSYCINKYPSVDIKVVFDRFFQMLATDPRLKGIYGTGCYSTFNTDEETLRWIGRLMRHYCVEGKTESLSEKYGFTLNPAHLQDGDFEKGLACWTAEPAEENSIVVKIIDNYGAKYQQRIGGGTGLGDSVAMFIRSDKKPNRLSQVAKGLKPGHLYCLSFSSVDYDDLLKPQNKHLDYVFDATISDAEILSEVSTSFRWPRIWNGRGYLRKDQPEHIIRRIVFRAKNETATVTFSDWKTDTEPSGPAGVRRIVNWIGVRPYYHE